MLLALHRLCTVELSVLFLNANPHFYWFHSLSILFIAAICLASSCPVCLGGEHTCVVTETPSVKCWGSNLHGATGSANGTVSGKDQSPSSLEEVSTSLGANVSQIVCGKDHTCAISTDGIFHCWGSGVYGRLGYGNEQNIGDNELPSSIPAVQVDKDSYVKQACAGEQYTCALLANGRVKCWGRAGYGQLGYGQDGFTFNIGNDELALNATYVNVTGDSNEFVSSISCLLAHSCVVLSNGKVRCWGQGFGGKLGYGNTQDLGDNELPYTAGDVEITGGDYTAIAVETGYHHTCAILTNGDVHCWGYGGVGALGNGNLSNVLTPSAVPALPLPLPAIQLALGEKHTCALLNDSTVRCWGDAAGGKLGYDAGSATIALASDSPPLNFSAPVYSIAASQYHTCAALQGGSLVCWGVENIEKGVLGFTNGSLSETVDVGAPLQTSCQEPFRDEPTASPTQQPTTTPSASPTPAPPTAEMMPAVSSSDETKGEQEQGNETVLVLVVCMAILALCLTAAGAAALAYRSKYKEAAARRRRPKLDIQMAATSEKRKSVTMGSRSPARSPRHVPENHYMALDELSSSPTYDSVPPQKNVLDTSSSSSSSSASSFSPLKRGGAAPVYDAVGAAAPQYDGVGAPIRSKSMARKSRRRASQQYADVPLRSKSGERRSRSNQYDDVGAVL